MKIINHFAHDIFILVWLNGLCLCVAVAVRRIRPYPGYRRQKIKRKNKEGKKKVDLSSFSLFLLPISFHLNLEALVPREIGSYFGCGIQFLQENQCAVQFCYCYSQSWKKWFKSDWLQFFTTSEQPKVQKLLKMGSFSPKLIIKGGYESKFR